MPRRRNEGDPDRSGLFRPPRGLRQPPFRLCGVRRGGTDGRDARRRPVVADGSGARGGGAAGGAGGRTGVRACPSPPLATTPARRPGRSPRRPLPRPRPVRPGDRRGAGRGGGAAGCSHGWGVLRWITAAANRPARALRDRLAVPTPWVTSNMARCGAVRRRRRAVAVPATRAAAAGYRCLAAQRGAAAGSGGARRSPFRHWRGGGGIAIVMPTGDVPCPTGPISGSTGAAAG